MNTTERLAAIEALRHQLDLLLTLDEQALYPTLDHLDDLITDLHMELN